MLILVGFFYDLAKSFDNKTIKYNNKINVVILMFF